MSVSRHDKEQNKCQGNKYIFVNIKMGVHNSFNYLPYVL